MVSRRLPLAYTGLLQAGLLGQRRRYDGSIFLANVGTMTVRDSLPAFNSESRWRYFKGYSPTIDSTKLPWDKAGCADSFQIHLNVRPRPLVFGAPFIGLLTFGLLAGLGFWLFGWPLALAGRWPFKFLGKPSGTLPSPNSGTLPSPNELGVFEGADRLPDSDGKCGNCTCLKRRQSTLLTP